MVWATMSPMNCVRFNGHVRMRQLRKLASEFRLTLDCMRSLQLFTRARNRPLTIGFANIEARDIEFNTSYSQSSCLVKVFVRAIGIFPRHWVLDVFAPYVVIEP